MRARALSDASHATPFDAAAAGKTLFDALIGARERHGGKTVILEDQDRRPLTYTDLIRAAFALGRRRGVEGGRVGCV